MTASCILLVTLMIIVIHLYIEEVSGWLCFFRLNEFLWIAIFLLMIFFLSFSELNYIEHLKLSYVLTKRIIII